MTLLMALLLGTASAGTADVYTPSSDASYQGGVAGEVAAAPWWRGIGDPALEAVIDETLGSNYDVHGAWARVEQSRALSRASYAPMLPVVSASGTYGVQPPESITATNPTVQLSDNLQSTNISLNATVPLDLFGRSFTAWQGSRYDAMASEGDFDAQVLAVSTLVAEAYFDVVAARQRLALVETQLEASRSLLELVELRYSRGIASGLEVLQQKQSTASTAAQLPLLRAQVVALEQQLAVLMGRSPSETPDVSSSLPEIPSTPPTGLPADLVEHRPDLRAAADRMEAARQRKMSAQRSLLPSLGVSASYGQTTIAAGDVFDTTYDSWNVGATATVPIFNGGATWATISANRWAEDSAEHAYSSTYLTAIAEVESNLALERERGEALAAYREVAEAAQLTFDESRSQYLAGLDTYLSVLIALNTLQAAELSAVQAHRDLISARIQLHDALGGTWTDDLGVAQ